MVKCPIQFRDESMYTFASQEGNYSKPIETAKLYWVAMCTLWLVEYFQTLPAEIEYAWKGRKTIGSQLVRSVTHIPVLTIFYLVFYLFLVVST